MGAYVRFAVFRFDHLVLLVPNNSHGLSGESLNLSGWRLLVGVWTFSLYSLSPPLSLPPLDSTPPPPVRKQRLYGGNRGSHAFCTKKRALISTLRGLAFQHRWGIVLLESASLPRGNLPSTFTMLTYDISWKWNSWQTSPESLTPQQDRIWQKGSTRNRNVHC